MECDKFIKICILPSQEDFDYLNETNSKYIVYNINNFKDNYLKYFTLSRKLKDNEHFEFLLNSHIFSFKTCLSAKYMLPRLIDLSDNGINSTRLKIPRNMFVTLWGFPTFLFSDAEINNY